MREDDRRVPRIEYQVADPSSASEIGMQTVKIAKRATDVTQEGGGQSGGKDRHQ
jgi:hypothetical protein